MIRRHLGRALLLACALAALGGSAQALTAPYNSNVSLQPLAGLDQSQAAGLFNPIPTALECLVVSADQSYTAGNYGGCTLTTTGRLKVGLSSAATLGATAATIADLMGAVDPGGLQRGLQVDSSGRLIVADTSSTSSSPRQVASIPASTTDRSLTITTGGTAQQLAATNTARRAFYLFNPNASGTCWASLTTTAAANGQGSFPLPSLGGFGMEMNAPSGAISAVCPTTGMVLTAWESQ